MQRAAARRRAAAASAWDDALDLAAERFAAIIRDARPRRGRLLHLGPVADRGLLRLQQARQGPDRHQQRRHQLAPVHEQRGGRLQADARRRRAAGLLRRHRPRATACSSPARNTAWAHPILFRRIEDAKRAQPGAEDHRRRSAPHRHRRRSPTCILPIQPGTDVALFNGMLHVMLWEGLDRRRLHRRAHQRLRRAQGTRARLHAERRRRRSAASPKDDLLQAARLVRRRRRPTLSPVLPGPEPVAAAAPPRTPR